MKEALKLRSESGTQREMRWNSTGMTGAYKKGKTTKNHTKSRLKIIINLIKEIYTLQQMKSYT